MPELGASKKKGREREDEVEFFFVRRPCRRLLPLKIHTIQFPSQKGRFGAPLLPAAFLSSALSMMYGTLSAARAAARLARPSLLAPLSSSLPLRRSSIVAATGRGSGVACRLRPKPLRLRPPSAYNSMLPSDNTRSTTKAAEEDDLEPLPGLYLDVCGTRLPLGEMKVSFPGSASPPSSLSSSSSSSSSHSTSSTCALLRVPCSVDALMDCYIAAGNGDADPYWCRPWPSGLALGSLLLREPQLVRGKRVLDLGCGAGVAGIAAAFAGASEVVLADRDPAATECAALSAKASLEGSSSSRGSNSCAVSSRVVYWEQAARGSEKNSETRFDVVLASDVLYDASAASPLSAALRALAKRNGEGVVLVADPARRAPKHRAAFAEQVTRGKKRERDSGDGPLILESWEAVDEVSGEKVGGGSSAAGAVLLMRLRSSGGSSTLSVRWP